MIPIASLGLLHTAWAGLAMVFSSLSVIGNRLAFSSYDPHEPYTYLPLWPFVWVYNRVQADLETPLKPILTVNTQHNT